MNPNPATRFYLSLPALPLLQSAGVQARLDALTASLDIACADLPVPADLSMPEEGTEPTLAGPMIERLQGNNIAVLANLAGQIYEEEDHAAFRSALDKCLALKLDGVHIRADEHLYDLARDSLGPDAIIGVDCGLSRHQAMLFGERGAAYIAFAPGKEQPDLIAWWQALFEVPCVAAGVADRTMAEKLAALAAEFIQLTPDLWQSEELDSLKMSTDTPGASS